MTPTLYGYWRSSAAYRLRIALNLKQIDYKQVSINLKDGEQLGDAWRALQPQGLVPVLEHADTRLLQSPAILEWIEESWPNPALLPTNPIDRCIVRGWASMIGCEIHPLQNLRVLKTVAGDLGQGPEGMKAWAQRWMRSGLEALEQSVKGATRSGPYLWGDQPSMADVYLVPQMYNARRWEVDLSACPTLIAADATACAHPAFEKAAPENQPDAG